MRVALPHLDLLLISVDWHREIRPPEDDGAESKMNQTTLKT